MTEKALRSSRRPHFPGIPPMLLLLAAASVFISSCSNSSSSSTPAATTPGALATITITASVTTLTDTDMSETITASAADSNGVAITGLTFTWTSSNPNVATINPSISAIVPVAPGLTTISASYNGVTSNNVTLSVTAPLMGQYAFLVQGFDDATGDQVAIIGSFVTDGMGNITSGVEDINGPPGGVGAFPGVSLPAELTFTGTYGTGTATVNGGLMTFITTNSNVATITSHFRFTDGTLSGGVPTVGRMIEFDDLSSANLQRAAGSFYLQNTSDFAVSSIAGPYALQFLGQQATQGSWYVSTGAFTADGNGNITGTDLDTNVASSGPQNVTSFTATLSANTTTSADTTTFGQLLVAYTFTSGISQTGYLYIVSPSQALFMEADNESASGLEAGQILAQTAAPFSNASLSGPTVEYEQGLGSTPGQPLATIGQITFGSLTAAVSRDYQDGGTLDGLTSSSWTAAASATLTPQTETLTFASVGPDGRVVLMNGASEFAIGYLISPDEGFIMSATPSATTGFFQPQTGPFSAGTINGTYFGGTPPPTVAQSVTLEAQGLGTPIVNDAELVSSGNGSASRTEDISQHGSSLLTWLITATGGPLNITVASNGRATDNMGDIYYVIGPSNFLMLIPDASGYPTGSPPAPPLTPVIDVFQQ